MMIILGLFNEIYLIFICRMVADSDGKTLTAVVICEGNLNDPDFPEKLNELVGQLTTLTQNAADKGAPETSKNKLKVAKVHNKFFFNA